MGSRSTTTINCWLPKGGSVLSVEGEQVNDTLQLTITIEMAESGVFCVDDVIVDLRGSWILSSTSEEPIGILGQTVEKYRKYWEGK